MSNSISPFQNINERKHFIIDCYIEMLSRINEHEIIPFINSNNKKNALAVKEDSILTDKIIQSLSIYF